MDFGIRPELTHPCLDVVRITSKLGVIGADVGMIYGGRGFVTVSEELVPRAHEQGDDHSYEARDLTREACRSCG